MPWINVTVGPSQDPELPTTLADAVAAAAASAAGLAPEDVVVLVHVATAASGPGATVSVSGRPREERVERAMRHAVRDAVARHAGLDPALVSHVRV